MRNKVDSSGCCPAVSNKNVVIILTTIITCKTLIMAHFFPPGITKNEHGKNKQTKYTSFGGEGSYQLKCKKHYPAFAIVV